VGHGPVVCFYYICHVRSDMQDVPRFLERHGPAGRTMRHATQRPHVTPNCPYAYDSQQRGLSGHSIQDTQEHEDRPRDIIRPHGNVRKPGMEAREGVIVVRQRQGDRVIG
jgi:hypothetical protein